MDTIPNKHLLAIVPLLLLLFRLRPALLWQQDHAGLLFQLLQESARAQRAANADMTAEKGQQLLNLIHGKEGAPVLDHTLQRLQGEQRILSTQQAGGGTPRPAGPGNGDNCRSERRSAASGSPAASRDGGVRHHHPRNASHRFILRRRPGKYNRAIRYGSRISPRNQDKALR